MRITAYLLIDSHGALEIRKKSPTPHLSQVAIRLAIQLDDSWFRRPIPTVDLIVPNDHVQPMAEVHTEPMPAHEFVNARGDIEDEATGDTRPMTADERDAWENR